MLLEPVFHLLWPLRNSPDIMSGERIADPTLWSRDHIVAGEVGMRRADRILEAESHEHRTLDAVSEILYVEIAECLVEIFVRYAFFCSSFKNRLSRPVDNLEVVLVIAEERH